MRARKTNTAVRQEQIARSAMNLISRFGVKSVRVASVAREIGVVPSGIYRHFQGKDEILDEVLNLVGERLLRNVAAVREEYADSMERLHGLLRRHVELVRQEVPIPRVIFSEEIFAGHPRRRRRVYEIFKQYLGNIAQIIREGQRAGRVRGELDAETLALMFLGLVQPGAILWIMSEGELDMAGHAERAWKIFAQSIRTKQTASANGAGSAKEREKVK